MGDTRPKQGAAAVGAVLWPHVERIGDAAVFEQWDARDFGDPARVSPKSCGAGALRAKTDAHGANALADKLQQGDAS